VPFFAIHHVWIGPVARAIYGVDVAWLVGMGVAAAVYLLASRNFDIADELPAIAASEAALRAK
jgi:purine-cytosine permease-like protein